MSGDTLLTSRKSTLTDRKDATSSDGDVLSLREDEAESNDGTRDSTRRHRPTSQQYPNSPYLWSSKHMLALAFVFIVPLAYCIKLNLDSREHIMQLQLNNSACLVNTHHLSEKVDELKNKSEQRKKSLHNAQKEKEVLREKETQCRLENAMKDVEIRHAVEKYEAKEECRLDLDQRSKEKLDNLEYENQLFRERTEWLIECLGRQNSDRNDFILTRAFNAIVRAIESGLGINSDVENCVKMFSSRFQRRIAA